MSTLLAARMEPPGKRGLCSRTLHSRTDTDDRSRPADSPARSWHPPAWRPFKAGALSIPAAKGPRQQIPRRVEARQLQSDGAQTNHDRRLIRRAIFDDRSGSVSKEPNERVDEAGLHGHRQPLFQHPDRFERRNPVGPADVEKLERLPFLRDRQPFAQRERRPCQAIRPRPLVRETDANTADDFAEFA